MGKIRQALRADLAAEKDDRRFGTGWISGGGLLGSVSQFVSSIERTRAG